MNGKLPFSEYSNAASEENKHFYDTYITPTLEQNKPAGVELEGAYGAVLSAEKYQSFQDGFQACIKMLLECTSIEAARKAR